jgi:Na+/melibiose symporter-like transporter
VPLLTQWRLPFQSAAFRALFAVLLVNGIASAVPATLFMFFASDHLQAARHAPVFLLLFFGCAACSIALWVRLASKLGEARAWMLGMLWSGLVGVWALALPAGELAGMIGFGVICVLAGLALGADLALPAALLTGVIGAAGHASRHEAAYFGVWNWGQQLTLALAAGISLPLLAWCGYTPGQSAAGGNTSLLLAYALLPCLFKLLAAGLLWRFFLKRNSV